MPPASGSRNHQRSASSGSRSRSRDNAAAGAAAGRSGGGGDKHRSKQHRGKKRKRGLYLTDVIAPNNSFADNPSSLQSMTEVSWAPELTQLLTVHHNEFEAPIWWAWQHLRPTWNVFKAVTASSSNVALTTMSGSLQHVFLLW